jgi:Putative rhamnosyl transferase
VFDPRPIYGHIRFSFYGVTDTNLKPDEDGVALARLYDETRMARRFFLFEALTLPSLFGQTDRDFTTVILTSDVMPQRFADRLVALAARLPGAIVEFSTVRRGDYALRKIMNAAAGPTGRGNSVHFRLDDDDAVGKSYIARLRQVSQTLDPSTHITFPTGLALFPKDQATPEGQSMVHRQMLPSPGLATVNGVTFGKNPFQMMHGNVWTRWPVVSDPTFPAYIRAHHFENDTVARQDKVLVAMRRERASRRAPRHAEQVEAALADQFPFIDRAGLDALVARCHAVQSLADLPPID